MSMFLLCTLYSMFWISVWAAPNPNLFGRPALISLFCPSVEMPEFYLVYRAESGWDHLEGIVSAVTANINFIPLPQSLVLDSALIVFFTARSKQPQCSKKPSDTVQQCNGAALNSKAVVLVLGSLTASMAAGFRAVGIQRAHPVLVVLTTVYAINPTRFPRCSW